MGGRRPGEEPAPTLGSYIFAAVVLAFLGALVAVVLQEGSGPKTPPAIHAQG